MSARQNTEWYWGRGVSWIFLITHSLLLGDCYSLTNEKEQCQIKLK